MSMCHMYIMTTTLVYICHIDYDQVLLNILTSVHVSCIYYDYYCIYCSVLGS